MAKKNKKKKTKKSDDTNNKDGQVHMKQQKTARIVAVKTQLEQLTTLLQVHQNLLKGNFDHPYHYKIY